MMREKIGENQERRKKKNGKERKKKHMREKETKRRTNKTDNALQTQLK